jgi:FMN phosphatase YigB (HAD superfamily)
MQFKLIIVFVDDSKTKAIIEAAREAGATGCTVINHARGEGFEGHKSFFGLSLASQIDVEDAVGVMRQAEELVVIVEEQI